VTWLGGLTRIIAGNTYGGISIMKKIMPHVMGIMFAIFGMAVIALLMIYSFSALGRLFPGNFIAQVMGMVLFDVAALIWLGTVIYLCKSVGQYALSAIGFILGLGGTLLLVAAEVMMGGQELTEVPAWAGDSIVWVFILALVGHVVLYYAFKLSAPEISAEISLGYETAAITDEAMKQATEQLIRERGALGQVIAPRMITDVKRSLGLPVAGDVLELTAQNVDEATPFPIQIPAPQYAGGTPRPKKVQSDFLKRLQFAKDAFLNPSKFRQAPDPNNQQVQPLQEQPAPTSAPQLEEDLLFDPQSLNYIPFVARLTCQFNERNILSGEMLEAAQIPGGDYFIRVAGAEDPFTRVTLYDLACLMSGHTESLNTSDDGQSKTSQIYSNSNLNGNEPDQHSENEDSPT